MNSRRLLTAGLALGVCLGAGAFAQPAATPLGAARRAVIALKEDRLDDFTAAMHPEALTRFREMLLPVVEGAAKEGKQAEVLPLFGVTDVEEL